MNINNSIFREIIDLINQDLFLYASNLSLTLKEKSKELYLLKRKRDSAFFRTEIQHDNIFQKEQNFSIINKSKIETFRNLNESRNIINELQSDLINYEANNFKKFSNESQNNLKQEENNNPKYIIDNKEGILINNNSLINNYPTKLKYFNIEKNINRNIFLDLDSNNEIKVLKNRKIVYANKDLLNNYSTSRTIKKLKKINFVKINKTSSKYRGVSRNGNNWQALIMIKNKKYYLGSYPSEEIAAKIYDIVEIKSRGVKAKTNFPYNSIQIKNICEANINIKSGKISEIMKQISN